jgi:hypothetical protein
MIKHLTINSYKSIELHLPSFFILCLFSFIFFCLHIFLARSIMDGLRWRSVSDFYIHIGIFGIYMCYQGCLLARGVEERTSTSTTTSTDDCNGAPPLRHYK